MIEVSIPDMIAICIACMALGVNIEHLIIAIFILVTEKGGD